MRSSLGKKKIVNNIISFNKIRAKATINDSSPLDEAVNGLTGYNKHCEFITKSSFSKIAYRCKKLYKTILTNRKISCYICCSAQMKEKAASMIDDVIKSIQKVLKIE